VGRALVLWIVRWKTSGDELAAISMLSMFVNEDWITGEPHNASSSSSSLGGPVNVRNGIASSSSMS